MRASEKEYLGEPCFQVLSSFGGFRFWGFGLRMLQGFVGFRV